MNFRILTDQLAHIKAQCKSVQNEVVKQQRSLDPAMIEIETRFEAWLFDAEKLFDTLKQDIPAHPDQYDYSVEDIDYWFDSVKEYFSQWKQNMNDISALAGLAKENMTMWEAHSSIIAAYAELDSSKEATRSAHAEKKFTEKKDIKERLVDLKRDIFKAGQITGLLDLRARLPYISVNNSILAYEKDPNVSEFGSYDDWKGVGRGIRRGETSFKVYQRVKREKVEHVQVVDENGKQKNNAQGQPITMAVPREVTYFNLVPVFDRSQTYGEDRHLNNNPTKIEDYEDLSAVFASLCDKSPFAVSIDDEAATSYIVRPEEKKIYLKETEMLTDECAALINARVSILTDHLVKPQDSEDRNIIMRSAAYIVCQRYELPALSPHIPLDFADRATDEKLDRILNGIRSASGPLCKEIDHALSKSYELKQARNREQETSITQQDAKGLDETENSHCPEM